ncbi:hydroxypyruvate isomerase family protein [Paracoccus sp. P2]|uniref:hydroxypyruvate isomerase family protein n=1 Tax=Paracoccus sp. P2 TaxID=3248840 RepID=UPI00391FC5B7
MILEPEDRLVSVHLNYILGDLPLEQRFVVARDLGFSAVEFPFPYETPARRYRRWLDGNGLSQVSIGAPACDYRIGAPGFSLTPKLRGEFDRALDSAIAYATEIGCRSVHVFAGGRPEDMSEEAIFDTYCANMEAAKSRLSREGLQLVVESINAVDFKGYFMNRLDRFLALADRIGGDGLGLVLDVYHAAVSGDDALDFLVRRPDLVAHVQLADFPGRHEPGTAGIDFEMFFAAMEASGYRGSVGLEYVPTRPIADGVPMTDRLFGKRTEGN